MAAQAKTLIEAIGNLKNEPLHKDEFSEFFVDTTEVRGGDEAFPQLKRNLLNDKLGLKHYLFAGARGCGKSTELMRLQLKLEPEFLVLSYSVKNELEPNNLTHIDLLIATMQKLFEVANNNNIDIPEEYLKPIVNWVSKVSTEEKVSKSYGAEAEAGGEVKAGFLSLFNVFAKLTSRAKYDRDFTKTIHTEEEHLISELILSSNILITEIKQKLKLQKKGLLVIIEDLDKLDLKKGEELFFNYVSRLVALNMNTIYTFPIALYYNSQFNIASNAVDDVLVLPMIKTHYIDGSPKLDGGQYILKELLEKRMDLNLFESPQLVMNFIKYCGGAIFDLFRMIRSAANFALNRDRQKIVESDWIKAFNRSIDDYRSMISDRVENDKIVVTSDQYFTALTRVAEDTTKQPNNTIVELQLRQNLCILSYNDKGWVDVHPLVKEILIEKKLLSDNYRIQ